MLLSFPGGRGAARLLGAGRGRGMQGSGCSSREIPHVIPVGDAGLISSWGRIVTGFYTDDFCPVQTV